MGCFKQGLLPAAVHSVAHLTKPGLSLQPQPWAGKDGLLEEREGLQTAEVGPSGFNGFHNQFKLKTPDVRVTQQLLQESSFKFSVGFIIKSMHEMLTHREWSVCFASSTHPPSTLSSSFHGGREGSSSLMHVFTLPLCYCVWVVYSRLNAAICRPASILCLFLFLKKCCIEWKFEAFFSPPVLRLSTLNERGFILKLREVWHFLFMPVSSYPSSVQLYQIYFSHLP